jgi:hypothetical protein
VSDAERQHPSEIDHATAVAIYQTVAARRESHDEMLWQVPGLGIAAQAFLLTIALDPGSTDLARGLSALLAFVAALAGIQLLLKHRFAEETLSEWLTRFERDYDLLPVNDRRRRREYAYGGPHPWRSYGRNPLKAIRWLFVGPVRGKERWFTKSTYVWVATLCVFAIVDLVVLVIAVVGSNALG